MRVLVVYYSRSGTTRKLAERIARSLGADLEELADRTDRHGILGYLRSGRDAWKQRLTQLAPLAVDPTAYDLVIVGSPVWNMSLSVPVRTFLADHGKQLRSVAFFCTMGDRGSTRVFRQMTELCRQAPVATFARTEHELASPEQQTAIASFVSRLRPPIVPPPVIISDAPDAKL